MGVDNSCAIVVGLSSEDVLIDLDIVYHSGGLYETEEVRVFSPYFDSESDDVFVFGFSLLEAGIEPSVIYPTLIDSGTHLYYVEKFRRIFGVEPKLYLTCNIT